MTKREKRKELCAELTEIENDLVRQLLRAYTRGTDYEEFWAIVDRLRGFSELRSKFCGEIASDPS